MANSAFFGSLVYSGVRFEFCIGSSQAQLFEENISPYIAMD